MSRLKTLFKYVLWIVMFAILSEVPFDLMYGGTWFYPVHQNVIWTLLIGLLVRRPFMGLNHFMEEKLEETEML